MLDKQEDGTVGETETVDVVKHLKDQLQQTKDFFTPKGLTSWFTDTFRLYPGYSFWRAGDGEAFMSLWSDNLATQLSLIAAIKGLPEFPEDVIYEKIFPGAFAKVYSIFYPVYQNSYYNGMSPEDSADMAWKATIPKHILLSALAGVALAWLFLSPMVSMMAHPVEALFPLLIVWMGYIGEFRFGSFPIAILAILVGSSLGWATGLKTKEDLDNGIDAMGVFAGEGGASFHKFDEVSDYVGLLLPIAMTNFVGTMQCVQSASMVGDTYNTMESMIVDGLGTLIGAFFGSIFGTTVYIGHPGLSIRHEAERY
eukprot:gene6178-7407_t